MKNAKKLCSLSLFCTMLLCGCGGGGTVNSTESTEQTSAPADTTAATEAEPSRNYGDMRDMTIQELVGEMKTGWNLGNTLDAEGGETAWGNPVTTHEMIDTVAAAGFNVIRLPTTWGEKMDEEFKVREDWMKRVHEVVDYAMDNDMYVILNTHHETSWIKPDPTKLDDVLPKFTSLWKQIAEEFEPYGDHLLFEGLNEPRIIGGEGEWTGGTADGRKAINTLNKAFVDTVRATGGNNEKRALLITTFGAQVTKAAVADLEIPDDGRIIVSLHAYTPYAFTYNNHESWERFEFDDYVQEEIDHMYRYIDKYLIPENIPVIITEYGSVSKLKPGETERNDNENIKWAEYYLGQAKERGIPCVIWDNGYYKSGNELFGLLNRKNLTWYRPELVETITGMYK